MVHSRSLPRHVRELADMCFFENLNRTDVVLSSTEAKDMEVEVCTIVEATSWLDWWTFDAKSMAINSS